MDGVWTGTIMVAVRSLCARIAQDNIKDDIGKTMNLLEQMKKSDALPPRCFALPPRMHLRQVGR